MSEQDTTEQRHFPWREGMPVGPDVALLHKTWPDLKAGDIITYEEISNVLGVAVTAPRFRTITNSWRKEIQKTKGVVIRCHRNHAFLALGDQQKIALTSGVLCAVGRKLRAQRKVISTITTDNPVTRDTAEHQGRLLMVLEREAKRNAMNVLPTFAVQPQVRISPPASAVQGGAS